MRHVATILPSARSLFTPINRALRGHPPPFPSVALGKSVQLCWTCASWSQPWPQDPHMLGKFYPHMTLITLDTVMPVRLERAALVQWDKSSTRNSLATAVAAGYHSGRHF
jgi:hypothetical protein